MLLVPAPEGSYQVHQSRDRTPQQSPAEDIGGVMHTAIDAAERHRERPQKQAPTPLLLLGRQRQQDRDGDGERSCGVPAGEAGIPKNRLHRLGEVEVARARPPGEPHQREPDDPRDDTGDQGLPGRRMEAGPEGGGLLSPLCKRGVPERSEGEGGFHRSSRIDRPPPGKPGDSLLSKRESDPLRLATLATSPYFARGGAKVSANFLHLPRSGRGRCQPEADGGG